jgi:hypothetical protein
MGTTQVRGQQSEIGRRLRLRAREFSGMPQAEKWLLFLKEPRFAAGARNATIWFIGATMNST